MLYNPDIYFVQTLTGFKRVSLEQFNKIASDYANAQISNPNRNYNLNCFVKPSSLFYMLNKSKGEAMWQLLSDKILGWFNKKSYEIGFDNVLIDQGE